ncbi:MAG: iron-containing redox enzyme family protein [Candidatus Sericytochromatia bacterium]|nr:iron-containing redox enzyme family protein [Candidatus Sericytochromatia bacterium]
MSSQAQLPEAPQDTLVRLRARQAAHPIWDSRLLQACRAGHLTKADFYYLFGQYDHYSRNFTRCLAGLMANCESDLFRARLSENLWEEGGGAAPETRHAAIFRRFLVDALEIEPETIVYADSTRYFVQSYLSHCLQADGAAGAAFLSLGTEGIIARLYGDFVAGLTQAGIPEADLTFFRLHMASDDAHAETIEQLMVSYADAPGWSETCMLAMNRALDLRHGFFDALYETLQHRRVAQVFDRIHARQSLAADLPADAPLSHRLSEHGQPMYQNTNERLNIQFSVERVPFAAEVIDPRIVRIPAGKYNENHRHAHETVFYIVQGTGQVIIDDRTIPVQAGDIAFVPRWATHQSQNTGAGEMVILALTDFGLTGRAAIGDAFHTPRHQATEPSPPEPVQGEPPSR